MNTKADKISRNNDLIFMAQSEDEQVSMQAMQRLIQIGTIGMMKAIRSFSFERGNAFSTYAVPLIMGEIKRHLRDDGPIKVSRTYKKLSMELSRARNRISSEEGREPTIAELAEACGVSVEEASVAFEAVSPIASLSESFGDDEKLTLESQLSSDDCEIERLNDKIALGQAISKMPKEWQKIVILRYYRDMTQQQVADALGLSQVKISREEKKIIEFLRCELVV